MTWLLALSKPPVFELGVLSFKTSFHSPLEASARFSFWLGQKIYLAGSIRRGGLPTRAHHSTNAE